MSATIAQKLQIAGTWAAVFHDLGKLEDSNQRVLNSSDRNSLGYPHESAGRSTASNKGNELRHG